ncbi:MAG: DNA methyltransferase [Bacteroidetes bacterium]|nr:DNA methyltransferase [Bacteroidota bacterium]
MQQLSLDISHPNHFDTPPEKVAFDKKINQIQPKDQAIHDWYRFVLSFPPHLVRKYIDEFKLESNSVILDPFCGTGTTLVESKLNGINAIGVEANRLAHFVSSVKVDWKIDPDSFLKHAQQIADFASNQLKKQGLDDFFWFNGNRPIDNLRSLEPQQEKLLLNNSISPIPLHKSLLLLDAIKQHKSNFYNHELLAYAKILVHKVSNLHFGPEVGVKNPKKDVAVVQIWLQEVKKMALDLRNISKKAYPQTHIHLSDAREISKYLPPNSVDAVITSPPYPNEKDYTRTTRLESVILDFIQDKQDLRQLKKTLIRSNTRNVYKDDDDDKWVEEHQGIQELAEKIEQRRLELGKTSGFEKLYSRVLRLYFGGMARHLSELTQILKPGAKLAYVVGEQASYLRVLLKTGELLADIAQAQGYELIKRDLFRTRFSTATQQQLKEEVIVLRWKGR